MGAGRFFHSLDPANPQAGSGFASTHMLGEFSGELAEAWVCMTCSDLIAMLIEMAQNQNRHSSVRC